jgi:hypothetical protein
MLNVVEGSRVDVKCCPPSHHVYLRHWHPTVFVNKRMFHVKMTPTEMKLEKFTLLDVRHFVGKLEFHLHLSSNWKRLL